MKELLINFAFDSDNNVVFVKDAVKGIPYKCPECGEELVFKSSGKTGQGSRRAHFAHKSEGGSNCTPESLLHSAFKLKTAEILQEKISCGCKEFILKYKCTGCSKSYSGNILYMAKDVKVEFDMGVCRPDIALLDAKGKVVIVVEIVNTHYPEERVLKYYRDNGIVLVQYKVTEVDLQDIEEKLHNPNQVFLCIDSNCKEHMSSNIYRVLKKLPIICQQRKYDGYAYVAECYTILGQKYFSNVIDWDLLKSNGIELSALMLKNLYIGNTKIKVIADKCKCTPRFVFTLPQRFKRSRRF